MELMTAICIAALMFSAVTAIFSILSYAKVVGMEKSTHQIQYMPIEQPGAENESPNFNSEEARKSLYPTFEDDV